MSSVACALHVLLLVLSAAAFLLGNRRGSDQQQGIIREKKNKAPCIQGRAGLGTYHSVVFLLWEGGREQNEK